VFCPRPYRGRGQRDENAGAKGEISKGKGPLFNPRSTPTPSGIVTHETTRSSASVCVLGRTSPFRFAFTGKSLWSGVWTWILDLPIFSDFSKNYLYLGTLLYSRFITSKPSSADSSPETSTPGLLSNSTVSTACTETQRPQRAIRWNMSSRS
jgi:hypothetical protein